MVYEFADAAGAEAYQERNLTRLGESGAKFDIAQPGVAREVAIMQYQRLLS